LLSLSFWLSHQNPVCIALLSHACYTPYPPHHPWLDILIISLQKVLVMMLIITQNKCRNIYFKHCRVTSLRIHLSETNC
jgi:hypothetical protein